MIIVTVQRMRCQTPETQPKMQGSESKQVLEHLTLRWRVVSCAQVWLAAVPSRKTRVSVRQFQKQFERRDGGAGRLDALVFANSPTAWRLPR
jgi:hypothetical protein